MTLVTWRTIRCLVAGAALMAPLRAQESYLSMTADAARKIALSTRETGQAGKTLDLRILATDRSYNYKLRATWMTPEVIRANARLLQISQRLKESEARALVKEAESIEGTVILVEIDPREGSGVIPSEWFSVLQSKSSHRSEGVRGVVNPELRSVKALASAARRDYSYDVFWVVFPLHTAEGEPVFREEDREAELEVHIYEKTGIVRWPVPQSIRERGSRQVGEAGRGEVKAAR